MDFSLSDEQRMIQDTARSLFNKECGLDLVRAAWQDHNAAKPLWEKHLNEWVEIALGDLADLALFMEEYGRTATPGEFFANVLAQQVATEAGLSLSGSATVAVAGEDGLWQPNQQSTKHFVPSAHDVEQIIVVTGSEQIIQAALVSTTDVTINEVEHMDQLRPQCTVTVNAMGETADIAPGQWSYCVQRCLVTTAAELVGVGRYLLESAVEYAKEREQFGKPIGAFQGLQWKLVDAALELERAAAAVAYAAMCVDADDADRVRAVHIAKAEAGQAARRCARTSMQVHAGIGYTWEHGLHYWLRRAYAGDAFMGTSEYHFKQLAAELFV